MIVAVTGASGFLGTRLTSQLEKEGHTVRALGRSAREQPPEAFDGVDALIHLAGEPVAQRWNSDVKRRIRDSRVQGTRNLVSALSRLATRPRTMVAASAIGFYGDRGDELLTESSAPGNDFLATTCVEWEQESHRATDLGLRAVMLRFGIVLGAEGGALKQMAGPFKAGIGGPVGSGRQWVSWIHADDAVALILFALNEGHLAGPVNATAPQQLRNSEFAHALGHALSRPSLVPTPGFALKLMFGEMADVLLGGQRVVPDAATRAGFQFTYPGIKRALSQIFG